MKKTGGVNNKASLNLKSILKVASPPAPAGVPPPTAANPMSFSELQAMLKLPTTTAAVTNTHVLQLSAPQALGGSTHNVRATVEERGRMWFVRLSNIHWSVVQPLFLDVMEREWNIQFQTNACFCGKIHLFDALNVYCVQALRTASKKLSNSAKHEDSMWENICQADPALVGKDLLSDHFDISNIDKFHMFVKLCASNGVDKNNYLRHHVVYSQYLVSKLHSDGGLLSMRNFACHERRQRKWDNAMFQKYSQKVVTLCVALAKHLYGSSCQQYYKVTSDINRCLTSTIDLDMERLVFDLACKMIRVCMFDSFLAVDLPDLIKTKYDRTHELALQLRDKGADTRRVLCIPPMHGVEKSELEGLRSALSFLCSITWAYVVDFSGTVDAITDEVVPLFATPNWVTCDDTTTILADGCVPVYVNINVLPHGLFRDILVYLPAVGCSADESQFTAMGEFLALTAMTSKTQPSLVADSFEPVQHLVKMVRNHAESTSFVTMTAAEISRQLCSMPLLSALCAPPQKHILLRRSSTENGQVLPVPASYWTYPHTELLHLHCGRIAKPPPAVISDPMAEDSGSELELDELDLCDSASETEEDFLLSDELEAEAEHQRYVAHVEKLEQQIAAEFFRSNSAAPWTLFNAVLLPTQQLEAMVRCFRVGKVRLYTLQHTFGAGGSTFMRNLLYQLRESFPCVSITKFDGLQSLSELRTALRHLHELTNLDVVVLVDLNSSAEYEGTIKASLISELKKTGFVRLLVCEHYCSKPGDDNIINTGSLEPLFGDDGLEIAEITHQAVMRTPLECSAMRVSMLKYCGLEARQLCTFADHPGEPAYIPPDYFQRDGLLNTRRILSEAEQNHYRACWQTNLLGLARSSVRILQDNKFWPLEILELSNILHSEPAQFCATLGCVVSSSEPLFCSGLFLFANEEYSDRVRAITDRIVDLLSVTELTVLKIVVFMALFAPGLRLDQKAVPGFAPSPFLIGLLNRVTVLDKQNNPRDHLYIYIPQLAYLLAENAKVLDAHTTTRKSAVYHFLKAELLPMLSSPVGITSASEKEKLSRIRSIFRPILHRAFNLFNVWHWFPRPQNPIPFSFLISYLWHSSAHEAVVNLFGEYATMCAIDNGGISVRIEKIEYAERVEVDKLKATKPVAGTVHRKPAVRSRAAIPKTAQEIHEKAKKIRDDVIDGEHARTVIGFLTNASRLREHLTMNCINFASGEKEYTKCLNILTEHLTCVLMEQPLVQQRFGTIHRRRIESFVKHPAAVSPKAVARPTADDLKTLEDMYSAAEKHYSNAIDSSHKSWAYPLVGLAQCRAAVYELLMLQTGTKTFDALVDAFHAIPSVGMFPHVQVVVTALEMRRSLALLKQADIASTYIKKDADQERTRKLVEDTIQKLHEQSGAGSKADNAVLLMLLGKDQDKLWRNGAECLKCLDAVARSLEPAVHCADRDRLYPSWTTDLESIQKLSICAHVDADDVSMDLLVQNLLEFSIVPLINAWRDAVDKGKAHGLGAHRASVMLAVYYALNPDIPAGSTQSTAVPRLIPALSAAHNLAQGYQHASTVRCFVARRSSLPRQPLAAFVGVNSSGALAALQRNGTQNSHSDWAREFNDPQSNIRLFDGEVNVTDNKKTVYCALLGYSLRFHGNNYYYKHERDPEPGTSVKFAIGINDHGLWAYGLHVA